MKRDELEFYSFFIWFGFPYPRKMGWFSWFVLPSLNLGRFLCTKKKEPPSKYPLFSRMLFCFVSCEFFLVCLFAREQKSAVIKPNTPIVIFVVPRLP